jgi:hypothetical protein
MLRLILVFRSLAVGTDAAIQSLFGALLFHLWSVVTRRRAPSESEPPESLR